MKSITCSYEGVPVTLEELLEHLNANDPHPERGQITLNYDSFFREMKICRGDKVNGIYEEWYPNGQLSSRCNYSNSQPDGLRESWYENGNKFMRIEYDKGIKNGVDETCFDDGTLWVRQHYKNGVKHGLYQGRSRGEPRFNMEYYIDGQPVGMSHALAYAGALSQLIQEAHNAKDTKEESSMEEFLTIEKSINRLLGIKEDGKKVEIKEQVTAKPSISSEKGANCRFSNKYKPSELSIKTQRELSRIPKPAKPKRNGDLIFRNNKSKTIKR